MKKGYDQRSKGCDEVISNMSLRSINFLGNSRTHGTAFNDNEFSNSGNSHSDMFIQHHLDLNSTWNHVSTSSFFSKASARTFKPKTPRGSVSRYGTRVRLGLMGVLSTRCFRAEMDFCWLVRTWSTNTCALLSPRTWLTMTFFTLMGKSGDSKVRSFNKRILSRTASSVGTVTMRNSVCSALANKSSKSYIWNWKLSSVDRAWAAADSQSWDPAAPEINIFTAALLLILLAMFKSLSMSSARKLGVLSIRNVWPAQTDQRETCQGYVDHY